MENRHDVSDPCGRVNTVTSSPIPHQPGPDQPQHEASDAAARVSSPPSAAFHAEARERLIALTGRDADFRPGQLEAISALVEQRRRVLVVQKTGWGKSAVYFLAAHLLRRRGRGVSLIVSPLIALMRDQISAAERAGVRAQAVNSANAHEWDAVVEALSADELDVLLISPERLANPRFRDEVLPGLLERLGMLVVDEAHCISDWGHDFRPDYRRIGEIVRSLPAEVPVLATTATANSRVVDDVAAQLAPPEDSSGKEVMVLRGSLSRDSLRLGVLTLPESEQRIAWLTQHLSSLTGSGIVYALTVSQAQDLTRHLREHGHEVAAYTGQTDPDERQQLEAALKENRVKALIATSALGMGFDKPDLASWCTWGRRRRRCPTTSRSAVPGVRWTTQMCCCSRAGRTCGSGSTSPRPPCPLRSGPTPCWPPWPSIRRSRSPWRVWRRWWRSAAPPWSCC